MPDRVDLYDSAYENYESDVYRLVRCETYGEDLGQTSWVTTEESNTIPALLELNSNSYALEIGCGSGRFALRVAERVGCRVAGLDINARGIRNANQLAKAAALDSRVHFAECDVSKRLPYANDTFDAVFSNDVLCHVPGRPAVLREFFRVLKPGGRLLFSDALVIGGVVSHEEIATRSSIGVYLFSPPDENERLAESVGFRLLEVKDTTENAALIAKRWHDAREKWRDALIAAEGAANFEGLQRFLACVHQLTHERRLLRRVYVAMRDPR